MKVKSIITKSLMCCILFATSVVTSFAADKLMIIGDGTPNGWQLANSVAMLNTGNDVWKVTVQLTANGGFKFLTDTDFESFQYRAGNSDVTLSNGVATTLYDSDENTQDNKFKVSETANYEVVCDLNKKTVTVTKAAYQTHPLHYAALWMVGNATPGGWNIGDGTQLTQNTDNPVVYSATTKLGVGEFKLATNIYADYGQNMFQKDATDETKMVLGGDDNKWNITESATYDITVNVFEKTISIIKNSSAGISSINANDKQSTAEYFTLDGKRLNAPIKGVNIMRIGNKTVKVCK